MILRVRKLDENGDMTFGASQLNFWVDTPDAVAQIVQTACLLWLGEWYVDVTLGLPWIQGVLGKNNESVADVTVQDYIENVTGVTDVSSFSSQSDQNKRLYTAAVSIDTIFGPTQVQVANQNLF